MNFPIRGISLVLLLGIALSVTGQEEPPLPEGLSGPSKKKKTKEEPVLPEGLKPSKKKAEEPALPPGLGPGAKKKPEEPTLPPGLVPVKKKTEEPTLPPGLTQAHPAEKPGKAQKEAWRPSLDLTGFFEGRVGMRTQHDKFRHHRIEREASIGETRLQLEMEKGFDFATFKLTTDWLYDPVSGRHALNLETGQGFLDVREASAQTSPLDFMDVKIGRQILTWGTGDMLFLNDLFPKDWNSFFIGRDVEYLKAPSDALKVSLFSDLANLDVVYTPRFDADRFIDGRRISYWNNMLGRTAGKDAIVQSDRPSIWFDDFELATRLSRNIKAYELAAYTYYGFWKSPGGMDPVTFDATFPPLSVYGASIRGPLYKGIANAEVAYYESRNDRGGEDPFINNSESRLLVGYEQEIAKDLTAGIQYYLEYMMDYGDYRWKLPPGIPPREQDRHVLTFRITQLLLNQNLKLSFFAYYSPSDSDAYLRPSVSYKINDNWTAEMGGNVFLGLNRHTFFGQFENDTNAYVALRWS
ncbi:MAG: hypothetical protein GXP25_24860, partial [Planctomycetes bacterium]|nr:hypothetical protein [Planctomycetota bacterium]